MKFRNRLYRLQSCPSQPARAVWIEIFALATVAPPFASQPARAVWIEIYCCLLDDMAILSQPARAVWIEI